MAGGLTPKQARFVEEYLADLNATQAAIRAGYSERSASQIAKELLEKTLVAEAIAQAKAERAERAGIRADRVLEEVAALAFATMADYAEWADNRVSLKDSRTVDPRAVAEVKQSTKQFGVDVGIKLHDKLGALKLLGQHLGVFVERHELSGPNGGDIPLGMRVQGERVDYRAGLAPVTPPEADADADA